MIIDLTHEIVPGMRTYPGVAGPQLQTIVSREESAERLGSGVSLEIESMTLVGNTGTYIDAPFHFHADRADVARTAARAVGERSDRDDPSARSVGGVR